MDLEKIELALEAIITNQVFMMQQFQMEFPHYEEMGKIGTINYQINHTMELIEKL